MTTGIVLAYFNFWLKIVQFEAPALSSIRVLVSSFASEAYAPTKMAITPFPLGEVIISPATKGFFGAACKVNGFDGIGGPK